MEESVTLNSSIGFRWGMGAAFRGLGLVAQVQDRHQQALLMFRKSLDTFTELGGSWWVARVLAEMSRSLIILKNDAETERVLHKSLQIAHDIHATPIALEALAEFANLQAKQGEIDQALEKLLFVLNHPASLHETKDYVAHLRVELEKQLTGQQVEAAQVRARTKTIEAVLEETLQQR
jgi:hypothetical protein